MFTVLTLVVVESSARLKREKYFFAFIAVMKLWVWPDLASIKYKARFTDGASWSHFLRPSLTDTILITFDNSSPVFLKFVFFQKATKIYEIFTVYLTLTI